MSNTGVLILECIDKADPGSEGRFLSHMFNLMGVNSQYVEIRTKRQFLMMLETSPFKTIHITTHGAITNKQFRAFWTPNGAVRLEALSDDVLSDKALVSTACKSGSKAFAEALVEKTGARFYIAPTASPRFHNAILFAHWFYHKVFILKVSVPRAVRDYRDGYKNPHDFAIYY
ncbi:hypothetical protein CV770_25800 [Bradyrhizobium sp. AC87j1]|uniref:hypothetical protein n=1 Tax=Bradyrhizobium sp. AC87j1 TaxID=2055894 RepID=UPI000CECB3B2|nr:hypothetical protein [Bradyrhizobium sp. AC87j1]PPQ16546.1 hypothetical protein CV770_25800 [Bradyrhizobium sp. AC87j1]